MVGILVHGDNHFIVRGPLPDRAVALRLARHWTIINIGATTPADLQQWTISTREFRENLEWAATVPGEVREISPAVAQLLRELESRGIKINEYKSHTNQLTNRMFTRALRNPLRGVLKLDCENELNISPARRFCATRHQVLPRAFTNSHGITLLQMPPS